MQASTFTQACFKWRCYIEDVSGYYNNDTEPSLSDSEEKKTVWILRNQFGFLCIVDKLTGEVIT